MSESQSFQEFLKQRALENSPNPDSDDVTTLNVRGIDPSVKNTLEQRASARGLTYAELISRYTTLHTLLLLIATSPEVTKEASNFAKAVLDGTTLGPIIL